MRDARAGRGARGARRDPVGDAPAERATLRALVREQAQTLCAPAGRHTLVEVPVPEGLDEALATTPVRLSTMGRGLDADPEAFVAAAAAGVHGERSR